MGQNRNEGSTAWVVSVYDLFERRPDLAGVYALADLTRDSVTFCA